MKTKIDWKNKEEVKEYKKEWYKRNKERIREHKKKYSKKHYKEHKQYYKEYYQIPGIKKKRIEYNKEYNQIPEVKIKKEIYDKQNYEKNKEQILQSVKEYYNKNKEQKLKYQKEYTKNHKVKIKKFKKEWCKKNKNQIWEYKQKYYQKEVEEENKRRKKLALPLIGSGWTSEMELLGYVHSLLQDYEILIHHRKILGEWGYQGLELDIYIPQLKLAFEYMGRQHYELINYFHTKEEFEYQQYKDRCKKKICNLKGIKLIRIRYDEKLSEQLVLSKLKYIPSLIAGQEKII